MLLVIPLVGPFLSTGPYMSTLKYGPLGDATYHLVVPSGFRQEGFLYVFIMLVNVNSNSKIFY